MASSTWQEAVENLKYLSSVATFESNSHESFVQNLANCILSALQKCYVPDTSESESSAKPNERTIHYESALVDNCLSAIDWIEICKHHQKSAGRISTTAETLNTPLQEILMLLVDPRIFPYALDYTLVRVLVRVFLSFSSLPLAKVKKQRNNNTLPSCSRWSPTQNCLLKTLLNIVKRSSQCRQDLGNIILSLVTNYFCDQDPSYSARKSALSLIKYCYKDLSHSKITVGGNDPTLSLFSSLATLLQMIMEEKGSVSDNNPSPYYCTNCGKHKLQVSAATSRKRRRTPVVDMADMHGELDEEEQQHLQRTKYERPMIRVDRGSSCHLTLKQLVNAKDPEDSNLCPHCHHHQSSEKSPPANETTIKAWQGLRDKIIHTMIDLCQNARFPSFERALALMKACLLNTVAMKNPHVRLCVFQLANELGQDGYRYLTTTLWETACQRDASYLQWYAEAIIESSFFDIREECWKALAPLVTKIKELCQVSEVEEGERPTSAPSYLLPCFGYILSRRRRIFQTRQDSIEEDFTFLISQLSISYGDIDFWVPSYDGQWDQTRQNVVVALQTLGILGVSSFMLDDSENEEEAMESPSYDKAHGLSWSYPSAKDLRQAYRRMMPDPCANSESANQKLQLSSNLLSAIDHDNRQMLEMKSESQSNDSATRPLKSDIPMLQYLDDDVLRNIFSYMGYKKLLKIRGVCRVWKNLADEDRLWQQLYRSRYGILRDQEMLSADANAEKQDKALTSALWMQRFRDQWRAERSIRFKYNQAKECKYQICGYLDCYFVMRSPKMKAKHYTMHERRKAKAEQQLEKRKAKEEAKAKGPSKKKKSRRKAVPKEAAAVKKNDNPTEKKSTTTSPPEAKAAGN